MEMLRSMVFAGSGQLDSSYNSQLEFATRLGFRLGDNYSTALREPRSSESIHHGVVLKEPRGSKSLQHGVVLNPPGEAPLQPSSSYTRVGAHFSTWDREPEASLDSTNATHVLRKLDRSVTEAACADLCHAESAADCCGVTITVGGFCTLFRNCSVVFPDQHVSALFRPTFEWPTGKAHVRWQAPAALVVASYKRPLDFLWRVSPARADIVIYQKDGRPPSFAQNGTMHNLRYFAHLTNFGEKGGSREALVYLQFLIDFYDNLPATVVFSQDEQGLSGNDAWVPFLTAGGELGSVPLDDTFQAGGINKDNCLCAWVTEDVYDVQTYGWFHEVNWFDTELLGNDWYVTPESYPRKRRLEWPQAAFFAVSRRHARLRSLELYRAARTLTRVESKWRHESTLEWANVFERLWFRIFFPEQFEVNATENTEGVQALTSPFSLDLRSTGGLVASIWQSTPKWSAELASLWQTNLPTPNRTAEQRAHRRRTCRS